MKISIENALACDKCHKFYGIKFPGKIYLRKDLNLSYDIFGVSGFICTCKEYINLKPLTEKI